MRKVLTILLTILILLIVSPFKSYAVYDSSNFGPLSLDAVLNIARDKVASQSNFFGGSYTDFYTVSYYTIGVNSYYNVTFYDSDTINFTGSDPYSYNSNNSLCANIHRVNIFMSSDGSIQSSGGSWNSYSNVYYGIITGCYYTGNIDTANFFSTININCPSAPQYNQIPTVIEDKDGFFFAKDGYTMNFGVYCTENSNYISGDTACAGASYYYTDIYKFRFSLDYDNTTINYTLPSSALWQLKYNTYIDNTVENNVFSYLPKYVWYTSFNYQQYAQAIRVGYLNQSPIAVMPILEFADMQDFRSFNTLTLNQLLLALKKDYSDIEMSDICTNITLEFIDSNDKVVKTLNCDYTNSKGNFIPVDDDDVLDQTKDPVQVNIDLSTTNSYLKDLVVGDTYQSNGWSTKSKSIDGSQLSNITMPALDLNETTLDTDTMSFFGSLVEWWYSSPFGLIAITALTFLIIKTIIW